MTKFRTRLLIALITLIITVLVGLGILLGQLFKSYYLQAFDEHLKKESSLLSIYIEDNGGVSGFNKNDVLSIARMLDVRATITNTDGFVLYDSVTTDTDDNGGLNEIIDEAVKKRPEIVNRFEAGDG
jgi:two-component system phosphate regulon sensor histidine kinase PhoR